MDYFTLQRLFYDCVFDSVWDEDQHPRDKGGRFSTAIRGGVEEKTLPEEKQRKIDSVRIDFSKDNVLPGLNKEELADLGVSDKPVLLKKNVIEKNETDHPDLRREDYAKIIGQSLYNPDGVFPGNAEKPYFSFVSRTGKDKSAVTLLEVAETKDNFEIVHWPMVRNRTRAQIERKGRRIKDGA